MTDQEQRDRFAEIAFAELCRFSAKNIVEMSDVDLSAQCIAAVGVAAYTFADSAMSARAGETEGFQ